MTLTLPYPPTVNHYWLPNRAGGFRIGAKGVAFREQVVMLMLGKGRLQGRLKVTAEAYPPDRRRRDLDNILKALLDALQHGGAYADDSQIDVLHVCRREVIDGGKIVVSLEEVGNGTNKAE